MTPSFFQGPAEQALVQAQVDIGRLESEVVHLTRTVDELKISNQQILTAMAQIQHTLAEARGGWRTLMWVGGLSSSVGGIVAWFLSHVVWKP